MTGQQALVYLALKYRGDWDKMIRGIRNHEAFETSKAEEMLAEVHCSYVTLIDKDYPLAFKNCYRPPLVLFYYGDLSLIQEETRCVSYVGSREASAYGLDCAKSIAGALAKEGFTVVTGLAKGIDSAATAAALAAGGKAVGVMGNGIDMCYPDESVPLYLELKKKGLVLSEYPGMTPPDKDYFPQRNRIVAGVSKGIIVGEASKHSGTLITVGYALGYTKEIGCIPYPAGSDSACNALIKDGAWLIEGVDDVNEMMGYQPSKKDNG